MSLSQRGSSFSGVAVTDISPDGLWILVSGEEHFMPYVQFPWFKKATVEQIFHVVEETPGSYHWPDLDIDLGIDTIRNPDRYPLVAEPDA